MGITSVQVNRMSGETVYGPSDVSRSVSIARLKELIRAASPSGSLSAFKLVYGERVLRDTDVLNEGCFSCAVELTMVEVSCQAYDAVELWYSWEKEESVCR